MDLERQDDVARGRVGGQVVNEAHERALVLALAVVPADGGVHQREAQLLAQVDRLLAVDHPGCSREVRMAAQT